MVLGQRPDGAPVGRALLSVYGRPDAYYLVRHAQTTSGVWLLDGSPAVVVPLNATPEVLGDAVWKVAAPEARISRTPLNRIGRATERNAVPHSSRRQASVPGRASSEAQLWRALSGMARQRSSCPWCVIMTAQTHGQMTRNVRLTYERQMHPRSAERSSRRSNYPGHRSARSSALFARVRAGLWIRRRGRAIVQGLMAGA
jgi:hypothetical protein